MSLKKHHIRKNLAYIHFYFHTINSAGESLSDIRLIFPTPLEVSHLITFFVGGLIHQFFFCAFFSLLVRSHNHISNYKIGACELPRKTN